MQCSSSCPCRQTQKIPFDCHCDNLPYSYQFTVPLGHCGYARVFDICNEEIAGIAIEQAIISGGSRVVRNSTKKCEIVCIKTRKEWFSYKDVVNCCPHCGSKSCGKAGYRPWLLSNLANHDTDIKLPAGCYRFVVYDCNYELYVPGPRDIAMLFTVEKN